MLHVRPRRRVELVAMEVNSPAGRLYWRGKRPLWARKVSKGGDEGVEVGVNARDYESQTISLSFVRGMFDIEKLMIEATECKKVKTTAARQKRV